MILFPRAKINIGLHITEKRSDGYHNLQTIFYPVSLCDALEFIVPGEDFDADEFISTGIPLDCQAESNLVLIALAKLREYNSIPYLKIHLHKVIPYGAGLGGGSSDAACFLKGINRYFDLGLSTGQLMEIALTIGSDCPFFIEGTPSYAEGRGEITRSLDPVPEGNYLLLIKPAIDISTRETYGKCTPVMRSPDLPDFYRQDISKWKDLIINDFEKIVFSEHPGLGRIKEDLYAAGAAYSSLSGSGSVVYGIFTGKPDIPVHLLKNVIYSGKL